VLLTVSAPKTANSETVSNT